jgi:hypothetical protein
MVGGCLDANSLPNDQSDASVMACAGAVVWRFRVLESLVRSDAHSDASRLVVNEELVLLRSFAIELMQIVRDQRALLVACEAENTTLQQALQVRTLDASTQTDASTSVKIERDTSLAERALLEQTVSDLRRQLVQIEIDPQRFDAKQRVLQLEQERVEAQEKTSQIVAECGAQVQLLQAQVAQLQRALGDALEVRSDFEIKNAMLHELVKQLEISKARLETDKRGAAERYASLTALMNAVEDRAVHAERQHEILLQRINSELRAIHVQSP